MGEEGVPPSNMVHTATIAHELMEEDLQRELARHEEASRKAQEREVEARAAKTRAEASQKTMAAMMSKYEMMKGKLDATKQHLEDTNSKITNQAKLTEKINDMKARVEAYATKKEAVNALTEHVSLRQDLQQNQLEEIKEEITDDDNSVNKVRLGNVKTGLKEHTERMELLKANMVKNQEMLAKREQLKTMLERQCALEEKKTIEQDKIASQREQLLELKMKELVLQKARLERTRKEQEERKRATTDFMAGIDAQLEDMEAKAKAPLEAERDRQMNAEKEQQTGAVPKQGKAKKGKKSKSNTPRVMSPEPQEKGQVDAAMGKSERKEAILKRIEQIESEKPEQEQEKMSEEQVKEMVANVEGKCKTVRGDIAEMAMSEQYLRTKQALLMARKKEEEMAIATNIAVIRENEVQKMKDKVKAMQDLLSSRKQKLKITEEILVEKAEEKKNKDKDMEKMKRRESYVEKELMERVVFDKEPPKKK